MSESNSWKQEYTKLSNFIAEHSEVQIEESRNKIPESVRPEFYRLFNTARTTFAEEKFPNLLNEAKALSERYTQVEAEVAKLLALEKISLATQLRRFLQNPIDELVRELFDPLFDLLKGKVNIETFGERTSRNIEAAFRGLYHLGYEKWVALSLVKLLEADRLFQVTARPFISEQEETVMSAALIEEEPPALSESKHLSFQGNSTATFIVPDLIIHSPMVSKYISLRSQMGEALAKATKFSEVREWYSLDSIGVFTSGLTLVYVAANFDEISLISDAKKICRPDLIIKCEGNKDWYGVKSIERIKQQHNALKPILGMYAVSREPVTEQAYKQLAPEQVLNAAESAQEQMPAQESQKQDESIHFLSVGFDQSKLEPIINIIR